MIKVKQWLDENLFPEDWNSAELKKNGHYSVSGTWWYPKDFKYPDFETSKNIPLKDHMCFNINNEMLRICAICIDGKFVSEIPYLSTYKHLVNCESIVRYGHPWYSGRSEDEEIIEYIKGFLEQIKNKEKENENN